MPIASHWKKLKLQTYLKNNYVTISQAHYTGECDYYRTSYAICWPIPKLRRYTAWRNLTRAVVVTNDVGARLNIVFVNFNRTIVRCRCCFSLNSTRPTFYLTAMSVMSVMNANVAYNFKMYKPRVKFYIIIE
jgi:hypothetical protein